MTQSRFAVESLENRRLLAVALTGSVNFGQTFQTIDGFGAAILGEGPRANEYYTSSYFDKIIGDLGSSAVRVPLMPAFEQNNDNADPNVFNWAGFDTNSMRPVMDFLQRSEERGASSFLLTPWTPAWWMKTNYALHSGGHLREDMYAEFAEMLAGYVIRARDHFGVKFTAVSMQNEQAFIEGYVSGVYDAVQFREALRVVQAKFIREGLGDVKILFNEHLGDHVDAWKWFNEAVIQDPEVSDFNGIWGSHYAWYDDYAAQWASIANTNRPLWYTEISGKKSGWSYNTPSPGTYDTSSALNTASELVESLNVANISAYYYWQFSYSRTNANDPTSNTAALMDAANGTATPNPKYHALKHFYRYIRPGAKRVATTGSTAGTNTDFKMTAFRQPDTGASTIVMVNNRRNASDVRFGEDYNVTLNLSGGGLPANWKVYASTEGSYWQVKPQINGGGTISFNVPALSVVTLYNGPELNMTPGVSGTYYPIPSYIDAQGNHLSVHYHATIGAYEALLWDLDTDPAKVNALTSDNWSVLHSAAASPSPVSLNEVALLIQRGANVHAITAKDRFTPLMTLAMNQGMVYGYETQAAAKAQQMINAGANVNARDINGRTALMFAAMYPKKWIEDTSVVSTLLNSGADKTLVDNFGKTAYDYAIQWAHPGKAALLAGAGLDKQKPVARFGGYKPSRNSFEMAITENVTATLDAADISIRNLTTNTALPSNAWTFSENFNTAPMWTTGLTAAKVTFGSVLAKGLYRLTINAGAFADSAGNGNNAVSFDFAVLPGDSNQDKRVNFTDLLVLAKNYGQSGRTVAQGDANLDGTVNFPDLLILAKNYNTDFNGTVAPAMAGMTLVSTPRLVAMNPTTARAADDEEEDLLA